MSFVFLSVRSMDSSMDMMFVFFIKQKTAYEMRISDWSSDVCSSDLSMPIEIKMPALSPTMEEGTLAKWLVKEGDTVSAGDLMAEIETDKTTMEFEAVDEGTIAKILVPEGADGVKVGAVIAILAEEGEDASAVETPPKEAAPKAEESKPAASEPKEAPKAEGIGR